MEGMQVHCDTCSWHVAVSPTLFRAWMGLNKHPQVQTSGSQPKVMLPI